MTDEQDELLKELQHIADLAGCVDYKHFRDFINYAIDGLLYSSEDFDRHLGHLLVHCDDQQRVKLIRCFRNEIQVAEMMQRISIAKFKAETSA